MHMLVLTLPYWSEEREVSIITGYMLAYAVHELQSE